MKLIIYTWRKFFYDCFSVTQPLYRIFSLSHAFFPSHISDEPQDGNNRPSYNALEPSVHLVSAGFYEDGRLWDDLLGTTAGKHVGGLLLVLQKVAVVQAEAVLAALPFVGQKLLCLHVMRQKPLTHS